MPASVESQIYDKMSIADSQTAAQGFNAPHESLNPVDPNDHSSLMRYCIDLANQSPPKDSNYRVGALLLDLTTTTISVTGYTLELEGNTHAEQCCLQKLAAQYSLTEDTLHEAMESRPHALYTTVEPCSERLSGNLPCVERVIKQKSWIKKVYVGVTEPSTFVKKNVGREKLAEAAIEVVPVTGMESTILSVATAGHQKKA